MIGHSSSSFLPPSFVLPSLFIVKFSSLFPLSLLSFSFRFFLSYFSPFPFSLLFSFLFIPFPSLVLFLHSLSFVPLSFFIHLFSLLYSSFNSLFLSSFWPVIPSSFIYSPSLLHSPSIPSSFILPLSLLPSPLFQFSLRTTFSPSFQFLSPFLCHLGNRNAISSRQQT